ncbi:MAG: alpha/beta hydrolase, partial [Firmicutes bacterium]|nr:alpha/beta hydrolase [Bacillota bacterium]
MIEASAFLRREGIELFYQVLSPENPRASKKVLIIHGLGEHSGRHRQLAEYLVGQGYGVILTDLRGFGRSGGLRGHVDEFSNYTSDLVEIITATSPERPPVVLGHSFGGLVAASLAIDYPRHLTALILSAPALGPKMKPPAWKDFLARKLAGLVPKLRLPHGVSASQLSHDPRVEPEYNQDPLCYPKVSTRWYQVFLQEMERVNAKAGQVSVPTLILQGGSDSIVDPQAVVNFYHKLAEIPKKLVVYPE